MTRVDADAQTEVAPWPAMLRPELAATYLDMSRSTLDLHTAAGLIPAPRKVGGKVLYCRAELEAWARRGCPPAADWAPVWQAILAAETTRRK